MQKNLETTERRWPLAGSVLFVLGASIALWVLILLVLGWVF